jgi:hypothetical protein
MHGTIALKDKNAFPEGLINEAYRLASHSEIGKAEIANDSAQWLVVTVVGGQERIAGAHLIARRFAIYLPEIEINDRGRKKIEFMFPAHLFVFVWGVDSHWERIKACPGVLGILGHLSDADMRAVHVIENEHYPLVDPIKVGKKKRWRNRPREETVDYTNEIVSVRIWSAFTDSLEDELDSDARSSLLRKVLSLPDVPAPGRRSGKG